MTNWTDVGDEHPPQPAHRREEDRLTPQTRACAPSASRARVADLGGGEVHRRHDDAVEEQAEVDGAEAAQDPGRLPGIADLVELEVREHARAAPEPGVEEHRHHPGEQEAPPEPVLGDAAVRTRLVTRFGVSVLKVVATIEMPTSHQGTARPEVKNSVVFEAPRRRDVERGEETEPHRRGGDDPVQRGQPHGRGLYPRSLPSGGGPD